MDYTIRHSYHSHKNRRAFTHDEDELLKQLVEKFGENNWSEIAKQMPHRNSRQCRDRWKGYLRPTLVSSQWGPDEDATLLQKYEEFGPKWSIIGRSMPGRSEINIKNRWKLLARHHAVNQPQSTVYSSPQRPASIPNPQTLNLPVINSPMTSFINQPGNMTQPPIQAKTFYPQSNQQIVNYNPAPLQTNISDKLPNQSLYQIQNPQIVKIGFSGPSQTSHQIIPPIESIDIINSPNHNFAEINDSQNIYQKNQLQQQLHISPNQLPRLVTSTTSSTDSSAAEGDYKNSTKELDAFLTSLNIAKLRKVQPKNF